MFRDFLFKMIFLHDEKIFFDEIFFKVHLLVEKNRSGAILARPREYITMRKRTEKSALLKSVFPQVPAENRE